ncbi:hypothetical protein XU06_29625 (plasmid) [Rhodococcus erythropolis]|nr:hypothetical protein XU06_29625 [Rhodococcus erythropolis]
MLRASRSISSLSDPGGVCESRHSVRQTPGLPTDESVDEHRSMVLPRVSLAFMHNLATFAAIESGAALIRGTSLTGIS